MLLGQAFPQLCRPIKHGLFGAADRLRDVSGSLLLQDAAFQLLDLRCDQPAPGTVATGRELIRAHKGPEKRTGIPKTEALGQRSQEAVKEGTSRRPITVAVATQDFGIGVPRQRHLAALLVHGSKLGVQVT